MNADRRRATRRRPTQQQAAVRTMLTRCDGFVSAQELHHRMRREGDSTGLTTVYRHLQLLVDGGEADVVPSTDRGVLYRLCSRGEGHQHLACRRCGLVVEVDGPEVDSWAAAAGQRHDFSDLTPRVEIVGLCRDCAADHAAG